MAKIDLLVYPRSLELLFKATPEKERKFQEVVRKLNEVELDWQEYYDLMAKKGPAEVARVIEERLKSVGLPYIAIRGLEPASEEDVKLTISRAEQTLKRKFWNEYNLQLSTVEVLRVPRYDEWKDPPEEGSTTNWLWLAAGVAGAVAVPLLLMWLSRTP